MKFKYVPHHPYKLKNTSYIVCWGCGLLYLKNDITKFCIKNGCEHEKHPMYKKILYRKC